MSLYTSIELYEKLTATQFMLAKTQTELDQANDLINELKKTSPSGKMALKIGALKDENERLIQKYDFQFIVKEREKLKEANKVLRGAVEFYAQREFRNVFFIDHETVENNYDEKAREALASADKILKGELE